MRGFQDGPTIPPYLPPPPDVQPPPKGTFLSADGTERCRKCHLNEYDCTCRPDHPMNRILRALAPHMIVFLAALLCSSAFAASDLDVCRQGSCDPGYCEVAPGVCRPAGICDGPDPIGGPHLQLVPTITDDPDPFGARASMWTETVAPDDATEATPMYACTAKTRKKCGAKCADQLGRGARQYLFGVDCEMYGTEAQCNCRWVSLQAKPTKINIPMM